jgi:competence protein ComEC
LPFWDRKIELVIVSHPQADQIGSMDQVLRRYRVGMIVAPNAAVDSETFWRFYQAAWDNGAKMITSERGQRLVLGGMKFEVLWPDELVSGQSIWATKESESSLDVMASDEERDINDLSTVVRLSSGGVTAVFLGDLEEKAEVDLLARGGLGKTDVVKVGHHGSDTSSSPELVTALKAKAALVEVGRGNTYGHPSEMVIKRWEESGTKVYRTDVEGEIVVVTDGNEAVKIRAK